MIWVIFICVLSGDMAHFSLCFGSFWFIFCVILGYDMGCDLGYFRLCLGSDLGHFGLCFGLFRLCFWSF